MNNQKQSDCNYFNRCNGISYESHKKTVMALKQNQEKINHNETLGFSQWNLHKVVKLQIENLGIAKISIQRR